MTAGVAGVNRAVERHGDDEKRERQVRVAPGLRDREYERGRQNLAEPVKQLPGDGRGDDFLLEKQIADVSADEAEHPRHQVRQRGQK